jgi:hypothetical protein
MKLAKMMNTQTLEAARAAKQQALRVFEPLASVVGVGITRVDGGYGLKVNLQQQPGTGVSLPSEVNGVPIRIEVVGPIKKR